MSPYNSENTPRAVLHMNEPLHALLANFPAQYVNLSSGRHYRILFSQFLNGQTDVDPARITVEQFTISTDQLWSPIDGFVFTSTLLPTTTEQVSPPVVFGTNNLSRGVGAGFSPQITDVIVFPKRAEDNTSFLYYAPNPQYRLVDMGPTMQAITHLDIQVFWRHRLTQELVPVKLPSLSNVNIKVAFIKK